MRAVSFGIFDWVDSADRPLHQLYDERIRLARLADELGFAVYHVAEHHCTPLGMAPSPGLYLAAVARATERIRLGPLVFLLPLYHPLRLVEEVCMLDHLSHGRLELGVGRGVSPWELGHYGVDAERSPELFRQALKQLLAGLRGDGSSFGFLGDAPIELRPYQDPYPPIWFATTSPANVEWAAREGANLAGLGTAASWRSNVALYWSTWEQHRNDRDRINAHVKRPIVALNRQIVVADSDEEALRIVHSVHPRWAESFCKLWLANGDHRQLGMTNLASALEHGSIIAGSPDTVRAAIEQQAEEANVDRITAAFAWGALVEREVERSLHLFAEEVMPAFREAS